MVELNKELKSLIEDNALALATVDKSGKPHCIAVGFVKVVFKDKLLVTNNYMVETIKNIQKNSDISLTVWNKNWKQNCIGYELRGIAKYYTKSKWYDMIKQIPENEGEPCKGAILVTVKSIKRLA